MQDWYTSFLHELGDVLFHPFDCLLCIVAPIFEVFVSGRLQWRVQISEVGVTGATCMN